MFLIIFFMNYIDQERLAFRIIYYLAGNSAIKIYIATAFSGIKFDKVKVIAILTGLLSISKAFGVFIFYNRGY